MDFKNDFLPRLALVIVVLSFAVLMLRWAVGLLPDDTNTNQPTASCQIQQQTQAQMNSVQSQLNAVQAKLSTIENEIGKK